MTKPRYIAHTSGKRPVPCNLMLEVVFADGCTGYGISDKWFWRRKADCADIIAYRVIEQE